MATESEIRSELTGERKQLTEAVAALRGELGHVVDRGKKVGTAIGAVASIAAVAKAARHLRRG
jgi:hypothetical protein